MRGLSDDWVLTVGIEQPTSYPSILVRDGVEEEVEGSASWPDAGFNIRWARDDVGHVKFAGIFRSVGAWSETFGNQDTFGWGGNLSANFDLFGRDTLQAQLTYGEGIGSLGNDTSFFNTDAAFDENGKLKALPYFGGFIGYTHHWAEKWRSTATYGYVRMDNEPSQGPDAYDTTHYVSGNVIYQFRKKLSFGFEGLYGKNKVASGAEGDLFRLQAGMYYRLF
jgi:hypothetical protein